MKKRVGITGVGSFFPQRIVTNDELAQIMDTNDEWIRSRTGIRQRHFAEPGTGVSELAFPAIKQMLERRGLAASEIDTIIVATVTPDTLFPATACRLQHMLGIQNAWGFDLSAACSSFLYALTTGHALVMSGHSSRCLIVGADVMSSIINMKDRTTAVLFGDAAGCVLLEEVAVGGLIDSVLRIDGIGAPNLHMPAGGSKKPPSLETVALGEHYVHQNGREVYKNAITDLVNVGVEVLARQNFSANDLDLFIPHQANIRIIDSAAKRLGIEKDRVMVNIDRRANTTSATLPTCMDEAMSRGLLKKGDLVLLATFGAGYTWGGTLLEWSF